MKEFFFQKIDDDLTNRFIKKLWNWLHLIAMIWFNGITSSKNHFILCGQRLSFRKCHVFDISWQKRSFSSMTTSLKKEIFTIFFYRNFRQALNILPFVYLFKRIINHISNLSISNVSFCISDIKRRTTHALFANDDISSPFMHCITSIIQGEQNQILTFL